MKVIIILLFSLSLQRMYSQNESQVIEGVIVGFFEAFHAQDSIKLRSLAHPQLHMQTVKIDSAGRSYIESQEYSQFLKSIVSIPNSTTFNEKILGFEIHFDATLASVFTPYEFWFDGKLSHCGANFFQLLKSDNQWKITSIIDTRRKEGCSSTD